MASIPWLGSSELANALTRGELSAGDVAFDALQRSQDARCGPVWISRAEETALRERTNALDRLDASARAALPLFGLPFAVKDNIDVAGMPTTAGCPAYAYLPGQSASVVKYLEAAGAVCIGKTNLDQFATGLVGTRSPYGAVPNPFDATRISGGSSSGSAAAVALGHVAFALGTDTAGSGRVPAGFTNTIGIKPSRGLVSTKGVMPACRSLDCVSVFAATLDIGWRVLREAARFDAEDAYARRLVPRRFAHGGMRIGVFDPMRFMGDACAESAFSRAAAWMQTLGVAMRPVDFAPFAEAAALLYDGARLAERDVAFGAFVAAHPDACDPVVREVLAGAHRFSAGDAYRAEYRLRELARSIEPLWDDIDALLVPTTPNFPTLADIEASPRVANNVLGTYTNFANLLDLAAIALPAGFRDDGLPAGVTLLAPAGCDLALARLAHRFLGAHPNTLGISDRVAEPGEAPKALIEYPARVRFAVAGAHMRGMPLNHELERRDARFIVATRTTARYRMYALPGALPKPGLVRADTGDMISVEVWDLPYEAFGALVEAIPTPLAMGNLELSDGTWVKGFVCEPIALDGAIDITHHRDWRTYLARDRAATLSS